LLERYDPVRIGKKCRQAFGLSTPDFKAFFAAEAAKEGTSVAELIRQRCERTPANTEEEEMLLALFKAVGKATARAKRSLD
jgi:hypothetical protein